MQSKVSYLEKLKELSRCKLLRGREWNQLLKARKSSAALFLNSTDQRGSWRRPRELALPFSLTRLPREGGLGSPSHEGLAFFLHTGLRLQDKERWSNQTFVKTT